MKQLFFNLDTYAETEFLLDCTTSGINYSLGNLLLQHVHSIIAKHTFKLFLIVLKTIDNNQHCLFFVLIYHCISDKVLAKVFKRQVSLLCKLHGILEIYRLHDKSFFWIFYCGFRCSFYLVEELHYLFFCGSIKVIHNNGSIQFVLFIEFH